MGNIDTDPFAQNLNTPNVGRVKIKAEDFFATVQHVMTKSSKQIAFVVDWSNYLFGQVNALSETGRAWLQQMSTSLRDVENLQTPDAMEQPQSLLIFLCLGNVALPPPVYLNNPLFAEINIPLPTLQERESAILARARQFSLTKSLNVVSKTLADLVTLTDTLTLRDIDNLARLSRQ